jgi:hypothetical protein
VGKHHLHRYFKDIKWAKEFIQGRMRFRALSHYRDIEDFGVRGDEFEGSSVFSPVGGLQITKIATGDPISLPGSFLSTVSQNDVLVLCMSRALSRTLWDRFEASACVEVTDVPTFCNRVQTALPNVSFADPDLRGPRIGHPVQYYSPQIGGDSRWALPERIAIAKRDTFRWQQEYRLVFSRSDALTFQNVRLSIVSPEHHPAQEIDHPFEDVSSGSLADLCRLHIAPPGGL